MADAAFALDPPSEASRDWLRKSTVDPAERVPVLVEALTDAASFWTQSFCSLSASEGEVTFAGLRATRVADLPLRKGVRPIFAALRIPDWEAVAGMSLDREVVSTVVEAFFGGDADPKADSRPVSPVEMRIVDVIGGQAAVALTAAMSRTLQVRIEFDRTMPKPDTAFLGKPPMALLAATFEIRTIGRTVAIDIVFPQSAIDIRGALFAGDSADVPILDEAGWARQLKTEVSRATLRVEAAIPMRPMSLGAIATLKHGQVLELPTGAGTNVLLHSGDEWLFRCDLGQSGGFYTVRVDEALERASQPPRKDR